MPPPEMPMATTMTWPDLIDQRLNSIRVEGRWRSYRDLDGLGPVGVLTAEGREVVSFASNDYLGLTAHPKVISAAHAALDRWGSGSGGSRLITGARPIHRELEETLAEWKGTDRAVLFPTGFAANLGVLSTLGGAEVTIVSDSLNHASIIDGTRLARAQVAIAPHGDVDAIESLVGSAAGLVIVVCDTVFSMDGDVLDVAEVADVCRRHGALLVLDEAHAVLVKGLHQPGKVCERTAEAIQFVADHAVDLACVDVGEKAFQCWTLCVAAAETAVDWIGRCTARGCGAAAAAATSARGGQRPRSLLVEFARNGRASNDLLGWRRLRKRWKPYPTAKQIILDSTARPWTSSIRACLSNRTARRLDLLEPPGDLRGAVHEAASSVNSGGKMSFASRRSFEP